MSDLSERVVEALLRHPEVAFRVASELRGRYFVGPWVERDVSGAFGDRGQGWRREPLGGWDSGVVISIVLSGGNWEYEVRLELGRQWVSQLKGVSKEGGDPIGAAKWVVDEYLAGDDRFVVVE